MAEEGEFDLPKVARAVAELGRATVTQKKWQAGPPAPKPGCRRGEDRQEGRPVGGIRRSAAP
jgi:hypothetical protein